MQGERCGMRHVGCRNEGCGMRDAGWGMWDAGILCPLSPLSDKNLSPFIFGRTLSKSFSLQPCFPSSTPALFLCLQGLRLGTAGAAPGCPGGGCCWCSGLGHPSSIQSPRERGVFAGVMLGNHLGCVTATELGSIPLS